MNEHATKDKVIPVPVGRVKTWTRRILESAGWLVCLGLLAASAGLTGAAALLWLAGASDLLVALGFGGGMMLGLTAVWHLLHRLDRAVSQLR